MTPLSGLSSDGQLRPSPPVLASRAAAELMQRWTDCISVRLGASDLRFAVLWGIEHGSWAVHNAHPSLSNSITAQALKHRSHQVLSKDQPTISLRDWELCGWDFPWHDLSVRAAGWCMNLACIFKPVLILASYRVYLLPRAHDVIFFILNFLMLAAATCLIYCQFFTIFFRHFKRKRSIISSCACV